tara:strand:+ start:28 stop:603 length:576 start_codon:yes stop_codon:yes gene_type:complete
MSGIVGSRFNIRGSGVVGKLGTDGQVFTSAGAGTSAVFEAAAGGGGKILQVISRATTTTMNNNSTSAVETDNYAVITPSADTSTILVMMTWRQQDYLASGASLASGFQVQRDIDGGGYSAVFPTAQASLWGWPGVGSQYYYPSISFMDSPNTTSAVTYKLYVYTQTASATTYFGYGAANGDYTILQEIDGS